ncbi:hypothetical protein DFJ73DRAFT_185213 [Zopfochytrium polystomum]|nr:hypothetical protein DFJ73DRAFT_185213 [Zopfochytrium polystomum]
MTASFISRSSTLTIRQRKVLVLSSPTLDDLKAAIHSNTDLFLNQDVEILQKNNGKLRNLTAVPKIVGAMIQKSTFEEMACFHVRPKLSRTQSAPEQNQPIPTNARTQNNPPAKAYHAFLSYQWNCQHIVQNIYKDLTEKHDMEVWMDVKDMKGSISDAMAEGIDMSHTFVPVLTLDYQKTACLKSDTQRIARRQRFLYGSLSLGMMQKARFSR